VKRRSPAEPPKAFIHFFESVEMMTAELDLEDRRAVPVVPSFHSPNRTSVLGR
jgi:hypothetical protein